MNFIPAVIEEQVCKGGGEIKPALFTFFSGAGFLDLGFEKTGFEVVFVNEFHGPFLEAYKYSRSRMRVARPMFGYLQDDIGALLTGEEASSLASNVQRARRTHGLVGFVGGPPCPDFSVGGKNRGRHGENGKLSQTYIDLICEQRPDFFVFENVKGLWRTKAHRAFYEELKSKLTNVGYLLTDQLVNAIEYGAPQDRDRIILVGFLRESFPSMTEDLDATFKWKTGKLFDRSVLKKDFWPSRDAFKSIGRDKLPINLPIQLTVQHWFEKNSVGTHPNSRDCFVPRAALPKFQTIDEGDDSKKCFKRLHRWRYSPTAAYGNNEVHLHPFEARRISVAEALALQSLPREFELPPKMTLTDKFKTIGNGVPFMLAQGIAMAVRKTLECSIGKIDSKQRRKGHSGIE